jgi:hypothetical protein
MNRRAQRLLVVLVLSGVCAQLLFSRRPEAQGGATQLPVEYLDITDNIEVPIRPAPVEGSDGRWYLVYHLFLTNWGFSDLTLKSAEVSDKEHGRVMARYEDKELSDYYRFRSLIPTPPRSEMPNRTYPRHIAAGRTGVLFFWLTVDSPRLIPLTLSHQFTFKANPLIKLLRDSAPDNGGNS